MAHEAHHGANGIDSAGLARSQQGRRAPWAAHAVDEPAFKAAARELPPLDDRISAAQDPNEIHGLRMALLAAADHERERLGRELHDGLCQHLAGIAALSAALSRRLPQLGTAACAAEVAEIGVLLKQAVVCARDLAHGLCPAELREADLAQAIEVLAANVGALFGVTCSFEARQPCPDLGAEGQMHLFRIVQEAVHNAVIHGRSRRIDIVLSAGPDEGLVCISDDGTGLPDHDLVKRSMGLRSMAYRARMLGGSLVVRRQLPAGTVLSCTFRVPGPGTPNDKLCR